MQLTRSRAKTWEILMTRGTGMHLVEMQTTGRALTTNELEDSSKLNTTVWPAATTRDL